MSAGSGAIEGPMEGQDSAGAEYGQDSAGAEPVTEQIVREQSPLRTLTGMLGMGQPEAGAGQYGYVPVKISSEGRMEQGIEGQNDGITDIFRTQNSSPRDFNLVVEEDGNSRPQEDRLPSLPYRDAETVVDKLTPEAVKQMAVLLITYLAGEVPVERWRELEPRRTVLYDNRMLKTRDDAVAQAVENLRASLDKTHEKNRRLAQEVLIAQDGQSAAEEMEQYVIEAEKIARREVDEVT